MTTITRQIQTAIYNKLVATMPTYFATLSLTAPRIKMGNLQDDPEGVSASFMVHLQDPDNADWRDEPVKVGSAELGVTNSGGSNYGRADNQMMVVGRIGGGRTWAKKLTVEIVQFCPGKTQDQAAESALEIADYTATVLKSVVIGDLTDGTREGVRVLVDSMRYEEGGGPPTDYNWTTYIRLVAEILDKSG